MKSRAVSGVLLPISATLKIHHSRHEVSSFYILVFELGEEENKNPNKTKKQIWTLSLHTNIT